MTAREFFDLVRQMREAQKRYCRMRIHEYLQRSRKLEQRVDDEIRRVDEMQRRDLFM